ncbi:MAG: L,D-transpeptidase family protein [Hyphomicrobiaceae bacterium]|nr:L,D-transpeptidase family protein [Hyphomicrobiaceae bacterium]
MQTSAVALVAAVAAVASAPNAANAYDGNSWLQFGPTGQTNPFAPSPFGGSTSGNTYDRSFIRQWEANPPRGFPTLSPANIEATKDAIKRYEKIVKEGGWKQLSDKELQPAVTHPAVVQLRERLTISGHSRTGSYYSPSYYDSDLETAVKRFQASNGLTPTGIVDKRTISALNVPAVARLKQLKLGLNRLRQHVSKRDRYVVVNIPAAHIEAVEKDRVVERYAGVVGKPERKTPLLSSTIHEMNFNPVWRLPPTVVSQDLIPKGRQMQKAGKDVLQKYGIEAYDGSGRKLKTEKVNWQSNMPWTLSYRQQPGKDNPLGFLKINFHNEYSVYMHDTPSESLFGRNFRAASSGCIRVQNIEHLATWLLKGQDMGRSDIEMLKKSGERRDVRLKKPVPLYFVYITAWATEDGVVQFRRDLYQKDGVGTTAVAY